MGEWRRIGKAVGASELKPWSEANNRERLDYNNGLLLLASLDIVFEHGFISFDDSGKILISPELTADARRFLGIEQSMRLRVVPGEVRRTFLQYHRRKWRKRLKCYAT